MMKEEIFTALFVGKLPDGINARSVIQTFQYLSTSVINP